MTTPTKQPILSQGIITPSCDITPTRETARDGAYDEFASLTQNDCSEAPSLAPAVSVEHDAAQNDGAEPSPSSPFTYDGGGERAEPAGGWVIVGATVYYFHDDGTDFQVPARAVHHAEQALVHLKLALDVARQLHLIS